MMVARAHGISKTKNRGELAHDLELFSIFFFFRKNQIHIKLLMTLLIDLFHKKYLRSQCKTQISPTCHLDINNIVFCTVIM
jgi:hypothetical protein